MVIIIIVYTAIFGDYDNLHEPEFINKRLKFVCFTDTPKKSKNWEIRIVDREHSPRRTARMYKILSHKYFGNKNTLWIDGCVLLRNNPFKHMNNNDIMVSRHWRNCVYEEAERIISIGKDEEKTVRDQINRYRKEKFPENIGLIDSTVVFRRMTPKIKKLENLWWHELSNGSKRDQLSFNYSCWKLGIKHGLFNWRKFGKRMPHA